MNENKAPQGKSLVVVDTIKLVSRLESQMKKINDELSAQKAAAVADRLEFRKMMAGVLEENSRHSANQVVIEAGEKAQAHATSMAELQDEITSLRAEIAQRDQKSAEVDQLVAILSKELEKEKDAVVFEHNRVQFQVEQIRSDNTVRDQAIQQSQLILGVLKGLYEEKVEKVQLELIELRSSVSKLEKTRAVLFEEKFDRKLGNSVMDELGAVRNESDSLKQELKKMPEEYSQFKQDLTKDHREDGSLIADFHARIQKAEMFCVKLSQIIDAIKTDNEVHDNANSKINEALAQLKSELEEIKKSILESNAIRKAAAVNTHTEIQRIKEKSLTDVEGLRKELAVMRDFVTQLQAENQKLKQEFEENKQSIFLHQSNPPQVNEYLEFLKLGLINNIKGCLDKYPNLRTMACDIVGCDNIRLVKITGFQYALYHRDIDLCKLFLKVLTKEDAREQKHEFDESFGSSVFSFLNIINVIEYYRQHCRTWSKKQCIDYWAHNVAKEQKTLPAWVIHLWSETGNEVAWTLKDPSKGFRREHEWLELWYKYKDHYLGQSTIQGMGWSRGIKAHPEAIFADGGVAPSEEDAAHQVEFLRKLSATLERDYSNLCISLVHSSFKLK